MDRAALERTLETITTFEDPTPELEQYDTPAPLASRLLHLAALNNDLTNPVIDLGTGTGILAIGAALADAPHTIGLDRDPDAVATAHDNATSLEPPAPVDWVVGDAVDHPLCPTRPITVVSNPPFGAHRNHTHADRAFLQTVATIATVSYTIHNTDSLSFIEAFAADHDATVTHAYEASIDIDHQYPWHTESSVDHPVELVRIEWPTNYA